ncbi:MAG: tRNA-dihydrouridine synthase family protein [Muribaculaceae bacterium]|nr:tRNA-dihydrouridine synthase family protein [Muribaculaceae bacterium]
MDNIKIPVLAAPLQGVTDNVWRMAQHEVFGGPDAYYAPFMRVEHGEVRRKDLRDVDPERNEGITLIPQILACQPDHALMMVDALRQMGYSRIDINLGCPFPPIAMHRKGSGMLAHPDLVEALFKALATVEGAEYSVKMRIGWDSNDQWRNILPLMDLIKPVHIAVHPRTGRQQYKGDLDIEQFEALLAASPWPVVYNGSLRTVEDIEQTIERYPTLAAVMVGSGLAANPGMFTPEPPPTITAVSTTCWLTATPSNSTAVRPSWCATCRISGRPSCPVPATNCSRPSASPARSTSTRTPPLPPLPMSRTP